MRKVSKLIRVVCLCICVVFLFSSCEKAGTELSDLMIIQGIGIDATEKGYKVTVEILNNEQSGSPGGDSASDNKTKIYSGEGSTVAAALRELSTKSGNKPLFAHNRIIVLGEGAVNRDFSNVIDFFERDYDSRASQLICVAKGADAEEVIRAKLLNDTVKSKIIEKMLEESYEQSLVPRVRIIDAINAVKEGTSRLCIPAVSVEKNGENEDIALDGCALFGEDETFSMYMASGDAQGLAFLDDNIKKGYISADLSNGLKATFVINKGKTSYDIVHENGRLHYKLKIKLSCDLQEVGGAEYFSIKGDFMEKLKSAAAEAVAEKIENTMIVLQSEHGGDAVRYGTRLSLYDNELYENLRSDWDSAFKKSMTSIEVDITLRRIGEETFHSKKI